MTGYTKFDPRGFLKSENRAWVAAKAAKPAKVEVIKNEVCPCPPAKAAKAAKVDGSPAPTLAGLAGLAGGHAQTCIFEVADPSVDQMGLEAVQAELHNPITAPLSPQATARRRALWARLDLLCRARR
jgi:hypothetical protein